MALTNCENYVLENGKTEHNKGGLSLMRKTLVQTLFTLGKRRRKLENNESEDEEVVNAAQGFMISSQSRENGSSIARIVNIHAQGWRRGDEMSEEAFEELTQLVLKESRESRLWRKW